jgi:hypothetical protein
MFCVDTVTGETDILPLKVVTDNHSFHTASSSFPQINSNILCFDKIHIKKRIASVY